MKIGVFGDSFCDSGVGDNTVKWWYLLKNYGHEVTSYGESGSSLIYSAEKIEKNIQNFDFVIWTVTEPTRMSISIDEEPWNLHFTITNHNRYESAKFSYKTNLLVKIAEDYHKHVFDVEQSMFLGKAVVNYLMQKHKNLMVIPCFNDPLDKPNFTLYNLNEWEAQFYFPNQLIVDIYQQYIDMRPCHLSIENNKILSQLVNANLKNGIFQTDYSHFAPPLEPIEFYWKKYEKV